MSDGVKAWVLAWAHMPGSPGQFAEDGEVVAVLPSQWSENRVSQVLTRLYLERIASPAELFHWRVAAPERPTRVHSIHGISVVDAALTIGANPVLKATRVERLRALDKYTLQWTEREPVHPRGICIVQGEPECSMSDAPRYEEVVTWSATFITAGTSSVRACTDEVSAL
jgi:hypothetical protein